MTGKRLNQISFSDFYSSKHVSTNCVATKPDQNKISVVNSQPKTKKKLKKKISSRLEASHKFKDFAKNALLANPNRMNKMSSYLSRPKSPDVLKTWSKNPQCYREI